MVYLLRGFPTVLTDGCWRGTRDAPRWLSEEAAAASTTDWEEIPMGYWVAATVCTVHPDPVGRTGMPSEGAAGNAAARVGWAHKRAWISAWRGGRSPERNRMCAQRTCRGGFSQRFRRKVPHLKL